MHFEAVDDHAAVAVTVYFAEFKGTKDHVAREAIAPFGIGGLSPDAVCVLIRFRRNLKFRNLQLRSRQSQQPSNQTPECYRARDCRRLDPDLGFPTAALLSECSLSHPEFATFILFRGE